MTTPPPDRAAVELRLGITGRLGEMDYPAVLRALQGSYELLQRTAHRVLGDRADDLRWRLTGVHEGSIETLVRASETDDVSERELREIVDTYALDLASPAERLPEADRPILRDLLQELQRTGSGSLLAQIHTAGTGAVGTRALVVPDEVLPTLTPPAAVERQQVIGSVTGRLDSLNVHGRREASLWNELDQRRVVVTFLEADYGRVHAAVRRRVEVFGIVQEDADGRPLRVRLQDLEVLPSDDDLPSLSSLAGSMPDLTGDATPAEYLERNRRELDLG